MIPTNTDGTPRNTSTVDNKQLHLHLSDLKLWRVMILCCTSESSSIHLPSQAGFSPLALWELSATKLRWKRAGRHWQRCRHVAGVLWVSWEEVMRIWLSNPWRAQDICNHCLWWSELLITLPNLRRVVHCWEGMLFWFILLQLGSVNCYIQFNQNDLLWLFSHGSLDIKVVCRRNLTFSFRVFEKYI